VRSLVAPAKAGGQCLSLKSPQNEVGLSFLDGLIVAGANNLSHNAAAVDNMYRDVVGETASR